jgi:hypothetical protein
MHPKKQSPWIRASLALLGVALGVVVADQGYWLWREANGRPSSGREVLEAVRQQLGTIMDFVPSGDAKPAGQAGNGAGATQQSGVLQPYFGGESTHDAGDVLSHFATKSQPGHYEVLIMGGSVAANFGNYFNLHAPGSFLQRASQMGRELRILNYAHGAYKQPQQLNKLTYLLSLGYRPEAIIEIDGFNETAVALQNGLELSVHPLYPYDPVWGGLLPQRSGDRMALAVIIGRLLVERDSIRGWLERWPRWGLHHSSLLCLGLEGLAKRSQGKMNGLRQELGQLTSSTNERRDYERQGPVYDLDQDRMLKQCVDAWFEGSVMMHTICEKYGIRYIQVLQPTLFDTGAKPLSTRELKIPLPPLGWMLGARRGFPALRARIDELRALGVDVIDASKTFAECPQDLYYDPCHFTDAGNRILAETHEQALLRGVFGP